MHNAAHLLLTFVLGLGALNGCTRKESKDTTMSETAPEAGHRNRLQYESSPYLLAHADNPVDWYPWGEEALQKAREENKPIFLSIGYASCHWCHVMERESFENEDIAALMNKYFINIKVDREQRPDLDQIYMSFTTALTGRGGWPMSVFLTPDLKPFFAGTYFPPDDRPGMPGFRRVLTEIGLAWESERDKILESADYIHTELSKRLAPTSGRALLTADMIKRGAQSLLQQFDQRFGGFGNRPKFPHPLELSLFLRYYTRSGELGYLQAAEKALTAMAHGGVYDQLGGGFHRYSVDERWLVPHFEKMLYDNSLLTCLYADAYRITGRDEYRTIVRRTLDFMLREMTDEAGGFYSALDADSEGEEGKYYLWDKAEIDAVLGADAEWFSRYYGVTDGGNFEGRNILHVTAEADRIRQELGDDFTKRFELARRKLMTAREKRVRPLTDDKVVTSWNGLAVSAFCYGYQVTGDERYLQAARRNAAFVQETLYQDGRLIHSWRDGRHSEGRFLEDYAYYLRGLLDLYATDLGENDRWLTFARSLADSAVALFMDDDGTLYLREADLPDLIMRPRDEVDGALPAPGSVLIQSLLRLSRLTDDNRYMELAQQALRAVSPMMERNPNAMSTALAALDYLLGDKIEIVIVGDSPVRTEMVTEVYRRYLPHALLAVSADGHEDLPLFEGRTAKDGQTVAYVCRNSVCRLPVSTLEEFREQLDAL